MRHSLLPIVSVAALLVVVGVVTAQPTGVPSPFNSVIDPCMVFCPAGDITYHVKVLDLANNPVAGSTVILDFSQCSGWHVCPVPGPGITYNAANGWLVKTSNAAGEAFFDAHVGGGCLSSVRVIADGVILKSGITLASPDQDGSLLVTPADATLLAGKIGGADLTGDLNCSATVDSSDLIPLAAHMNHGCDGPVPVRPGNWGRLKSLYR